MQHWGKGKKNVIVDLITLAFATEQEIVRHIGVYLHKKKTGSSYLLAIFYE